MRRYLSDFVAVLLGGRGALVAVAELLLLAALAALAWRAR